MTKVSYPDMYKDATSEGFLEGLLHRGPRGTFLN